MDVVVEIEKSQACGPEKGGQAAGGFIVQEFPQPVGGIDPDPDTSKRESFQTGVETPRILKNKAPIQNISGGF